MTPVLINLISPARLTMRKLRRRRFAWTIGLTVQAVLIAAACFAVRQVWPSASRATAAELAETRLHVSILISQLAQQRRAAANLSARKELIASITDTPDWSLLLHLIDRTVSDDILIQQCALTPAPPHQVILNMRGIAETQSSVSQFVEKMTNTRLFADLHLNHTERAPFMGRSAISFELNCSIDFERGALP